MKIRRLAVLTFVIGLAFLLLASKRPATAGEPDPITSAEASQITTVSAPVMQLTDPPVEGRMAADLSTPQTAQGALYRELTLTLDPSLSDYMSDTWPVRYDTTYYNWPVGYSINVPTDALSSLSYGSSTGAIRHTTYITYIVLSSPNPEDWITVTYRTRTGTAVVPAVRHRDLITLTSFASSNIPFGVLTATLVYTRQFPPGAPEDQWGNTVSRLISTDPAPTTLADGWAQWVATDTTSFLGKVVIGEPLFGSDLTITQFSVSPPNLVFGQAVDFTVTIKNVGIMTATRWFATEAYLRPATDPPPQGPFDHEWGLITYQGAALFHKPGTVGDWMMASLGPGESITMITALTVTSASGAGSFKAYAQVDTAYNDPFHYAWFGANPEGYGEPPFLEENNVVTAEDTITINAPPEIPTQTAFFTETFTFFPSPGWLVVTQSTGTANQMWGRVLLSDSGFTHTLWSTGYYSPAQTAGSTYVRNMNTWAIYGPLNTQQYRAFETIFDVWTDMTPGASVGWAASIDGQTFCGQVESVRNSLVWLHRTFDLPSQCAGQTGVPAYLAFFFQSDSSVPAGLGAFIDNVVILGQPQFMVSGRVTDGSSNPVSGVAVSAGAGLSATTNASGYYTLTGLISGTYTLTPTKSGYTFSPPSRTVSVPPNAAGQDFVASHGLITEQDLTGDGTLDLRLDNGIMWLQVNRDTVSGVKGFVDAGGVSGQSNFMTYTVSSGGMVDQVVYWQTVSFTVQILTNTTQVGTCKVTDVERANGKEVTKEYTVTLAAGREYAEVEYRFTNTGSSAWLYDEYPSHIHDGAHLAVMFARELTDINAYINGVGVINLPSLTWWASYSPSPTEPFAVLYQPSNGNAMTFGFKAWDYAIHQIVAYYTGASPVIQPKLELMATPLTLNPGGSAQWKALLAFHTGGYARGAQIYSGYSISGRVTDGSSNPLSGATVSAGAGLSATTNASGYYTLTGLISGAYTLTPTKSGYTFSPPSRTVSVPPNAAGQDFTAMTAQNLLENPGFEQQLNGWHISSGSATYTAQSQMVHSGIYSAKGIETSNGSLGRLYQDVTRKVVSGQQYKISGWIKTENVTGNVVIALDYVDSTGWTPADGYVREIGLVSGTKDWTYYESQPFIVPGMPVDASALWFLFDFNNGSGIAYWDDVALVPVNAQYYEPFSTDVFGSGSWTRSNTSVSVDTSNGWLHIGADAGYGDFAEKAIIFNLPITVETRMRLVSGGNNYRLPHWEFYWGSGFNDRITIGYGADGSMGWIFNIVPTWTGVYTKAPPSENVWMTVKAIMRSDGGELYAKFDTDTDFTFITTSTWSIPNQMIKIEYVQPWDSVCDVDYLAISSSAGTPSITSPTDLRARPGPTSITLDWTPSTSANLVGYNVYRSTAPITGFAKVNSALVTGDAWADAGPGLITGTLYYYYLTAVDRYNQESAPSNTASATYGQVQLSIPHMQGPHGVTVTVPINVANATGLSIDAMDVYVVYTPTTLSALEVRRTILSLGYGFALNIVQPGVVRIALASGTGGSPLRGSGTLFQVVFNVPGNTGNTSKLDFDVAQTDLYGNGDLYHPLPLSLVNGAFTVAPGYVLGDLNGDGVVNSADAALALQIAVGLITPTPQQWVAGDVNGDGRINAADAALIMRMAAGLSALPSGASAAALAPQGTVELNVPPITGAIGQRVSFPINISHAANVAGADLIINYDPALLTAQGAQVSDLTAHFDLQVNTSSSGVLRLSLKPKAGYENGLEGGAGALATLEFTVQEAAHAGDVSPLTLAMGRLNDSYSRDFATSALQTPVNLVSGQIEIVQSYRVYLPLALRSP